MKTKKAFQKLLFWVLLAVTFNLFIFFYMGTKPAIEFLGGYIIEMSLSMDNLFLFLLIFSSFGIPSIYQKRVLSYGIIGAIVLRLVFILLGVEIVNNFHWVLYVFGAVLILNGIKMFFDKGEDKDFKNSKLYKLISAIVPITDSLHEEKFFIKQNNRLYATPLLAILILIEFSDVIFAIDSIPAVFSVTTRPFIVYTSNIFAILGLRSMYFLLEKLASKFTYVKYGVALILIFTGVKLGLLFFNLEIPIILSIIIIFVILIGSILISMLISTDNNKSVSKRSQY